MKGAHISNGQIYHKFIISFRRLFRFLASHSVIQWPAPSKRNECPDKEPSILYPYLPSSLDLLLAYILDLVHIHKPISCPSIQSLSLSKSIVVTRKKRVQRRNEK